MHIPVEPILDCDGVCNNDTDGDGICDEFEILCMDVAAINSTPSPRRTTALAWSLLEVV